MDLKLKVLEGKNAGQEIPIQGKKFLIGRAEDCNLRPGSDLISRHHCVLLIEDGYIGVRDFGSKNGTYVNETRVAGEQELKAGDHLTIGPLRFEIHIAHGLAGKKRPPVNDIKEAAARAAHDAAADPMDVTQWISDESEMATQSPKQTASFSDTDAITMSNTQTITPDDTHAAEEEKPKLPPGKRPVGKLPPVNNATKDSQAAAAAMLSKMKKRH